VPDFSVKHIVRTLLGTRAALRSKRESWTQAGDRSKGVANFFSGLDGVTPSDADISPIFVLSAGWRSGSTLLQRLLCTGNNTLVWGEAYDRSNIVQHLVDTLMPFSENWPNPRYSAQSKTGVDPSSDWIANISPPQASILQAYRALLIELYGRPAEALGAFRWGIKEVRYGKAEAQLLRCLFPNCKLIFIRRNLKDAYVSYRGFSNRMDWYARWPYQPAFTPYQFGKHWQRLNSEFENCHEELDALLIDYDDFISHPETIDKLELYIEDNLDRSLLKKKVGGGSTRKSPELSRLESFMLYSGKLHSRHLK
jgi:hypothetical protein